MATKKTVYKTKKNAKGQTVFDGSQSLGGKEAPTPGLKAGVKKVAQVQEITPTTRVASIPYPRLSTPSEMDWQQDYEDYLFGIQDIWDALDKGVEPDADAKAYFEEKAKAVDTNEFGMKVLLGDLESFSKSNEPYAIIPYTILLRTLTKQAEADIRRHKPKYDLGELTDRSEIGGSDFLYCSVCVDMSYPCPTVQVTHNLDELDSYLMNKVRSEVFEQGIKESQALWDAQGD